MATNYDVIIGKRIASFDAPDLFQSGSKIDSLKVHVPHQEQSLIIQNIAWSITQLSPAKLTYRADFETASSNPTYSLGKSFLLLEITVGQLMKKVPKITTKSMTIWIERLI